MRLTRASSYALHAVVHMAGQKHIAQKRKIPERFLLKVLKPLVSAGILDSIKGPNGGYSLARSPGDITVLDVIEAVDGAIRGIAPMGHDDPHNPLNRRLDQICNQAAEQIRKLLGKVKISDLSSK